jgi:galactokinase
MEEPHTPLPGNSPPGASTPSAESLKEGFRRKFGGEPLVFRAPGRVNLIGEHTDYNDGFVMPVALQFATWAAIGPRSDQAVHVYSENFGEDRQFFLQDIKAQPSKHWSDYVRGVAAVLQGKDRALRGANLYIAGDVPLGSGLSSSASLEVACAFAFLGLAGDEFDRLKIAKACQMAEHVYAGMKCGIMDQFAACFARAGHALLLDCRSLESQLLPLQQDAKIVICNSLQTHHLASSEYNQRRKQCEAGVQALQAHLPGISALRDVSIEDLERHRSVLTDVVYRRCRHVCSENRRVQDAARCLESGNLDGFGELMGESHHSLRDDYQVSCRELDILVEIASGIEGVLGARMTGGGFGGSTVNLVRSSAVPEFEKVVRREYERATGRIPPIHVCSAAEGAGPADATGAHLEEGKSGATCSGTT